MFCCWLNVVMSLSVIMPYCLNHLIMCCVMSIVSLMMSSMGWLVPTWECPHIVMYVDSAAAAAMSREGSIRETNTKFRIHIIF